MSVADWIALAILLVSLVIGAVAGCGKVLKFFTSGIFGFIISVFACYCLGGLILGIPAIGNLLDKFAALWEGSAFLTTIHLEVIVYYIVLFIIITVIRIIIVRILKSILEINFILVKIINRIVGAILLAAIVVVIALFVFQILYWIYGADGNPALVEALSGVLNLDKLYLNNPMNYLTTIGKAVEEVPEDAVAAAVSQLACMI
ncbi:MAG: hypothetical protein LUE27_01370 [Clostridia bacterium]|nr:hypothetical protein [Clostridia bacterium]